MTLEEEINELIGCEVERDSQSGRWLWEIGLWRWYNCPYWPAELYGVNQAIEEASDVECMLSPALYIREYRKWWNEKAKEKEEEVKTSEG